MKIETENQLVQKLSEKLTSVFNTDTVVTEMSAGYGIADLVFAKGFFSHKNVLNREPINNYVSLKILLSVSSKSTFSIEEVCQITGVSRISNLKCIKYLLDKGYVEKIGKNEYKKTFDFKNPIKKIVAIEAKLKDWKQGIMQARRYKSFTDESYLAILSKYEKNIDTDCLDRYGIGLILFNPDTGEILMKKKATKGQYISVYKESQSLFAKELFLYQSLIKTV